LPYFLIGKVGLSFGILRKSVHYALPPMPLLEAYLTESGLMPDNNLDENTIHPLALGRKSYMFSGSHVSAQRIAIRYSFFGSCKLNGVEPYGWLKHSLGNILVCNIQNLKELLPDFKR
jgi:transposase